MPTAALDARRSSRTAVRVPRAWPVMPYSGTPASGGPTAMTRTTHSLTRAVPSAHGERSQARERAAGAASPRHDDLGEDGDGDLGGGLRADVEADGSGDAREALARDPLGLEPHHRGLHA